MTKLSLYLETQKLASRVVMALYRVRLEGVDKPGYLCSDHADAVRGNDEVVATELLNSAARGKFSCDLCFAGLPRKVA